MQTKLTQFFKKNTLDKPTTIFEKNENIIIKNSKNEKKPITIYTDGACKNNGKKNAIAGIGYIVKIYIIYLKK